MATRKRSVKKKKPVRKIAKRSAKLPAKALKQRIRRAHAAASKVADANEKVLTLRSIHNLITSNFEKLTDRIDDVEQQIGNVRKEFIAQDGEPEQPPVSVSTSKEEETDPSIPGVTFGKNGELEIDEDETWRWTPAHMLAFVNIAEELKPPSLKEYVGKPRKMRQVLFDWMRDAGLNPTDLPPKGEDVNGNEASVEPNEIMGFTGPRTGMTAAQAVAFRSLLGKYNPTEFHHGDCVGADEDAHEIVVKFRKAHGQPMAIHVHPPDDEKARAFVKIDKKRGDVLYEPKSFHERNHDIVDISTLMVATPQSDTEELRSGTWATVRYARQQPADCVIIRPDGKIVRDTKTRK